MTVYRIADTRHAIFDSTGAMQSGGRWNSIGVPVIYASESYSGALLEVLVHINLNHPGKSHRVVEISIPEHALVETINPKDLPGWDADDLKVSRKFGDLWVRESRSVALRVPNIVTGGREYNLVFNPAHPAFARIEVGPPEIIQWDQRIFRSRN
jgi:RES domain-containing protein